MRPRPAIFSFTLTEILAAVAILSVLFTIMFGILQQTSLGWQAANRRVEASQVARLALEQIASELQSCFVAAGIYPIPSGSTNYAFGFVHSNITSVTNPSWIQGTTPGLALAAGNDYLYFVAPQPSSLNAPHGDLCEFGYLPVWNPTTSTNAFRRGRYFLLRHFPFNFSNTSSLADFSTNASAWETTPAGTSQTNRLPFVDNCVRFDVRFVFSNTTTGTITNADRWGRPTISGGSVSWVGNPPGAPNGLPLAADLTLSVLDDRTAEKLFRLRPGGLGNDVDKIPDNIAAITGSNAAAIQATLREGLTTFRRRVEFLHAPPP